MGRVAAVGRLHIVGTPDRVGHNKLEAGEVVDSTPGRVGHNKLEEEGVVGSSPGTLKAGELVDDTSDVLQVGEAA